MSTGNDGFVIHRILAAVDATPTSTTVLETAALLARGLGAELEGIFVEDINLLRLAGLPFARELTWSTAMDLRLDYGRMERALRGHASHARQAVVNITSRMNLHVSLRTARGQIGPELLRAAQDIDLLILGKAGKSPVVNIGATTRQVVRQAHCSVMLVAADTRPYNTVMTVFDATENSIRRLNAAARLAFAMDKNLLILIPTKADSDFQRLREHARRSLSQGPLLVTYQAVATREACFDGRLLRNENVGIVVLSADPANADDIESQVLRLECSVLIVR